MTAPLIAFCRILQPYIPSEWKEYTPKKIDEITMLENLGMFQDPRLQAILGQYFIIYLN